jgi:hypothetical protein
VYVRDVLKLSPSAWKITRTEFGVIPMEDTKYPAWFNHGVLNMGMIGGQSKPSTGFTFSRVQAYALEVAKSVAKRSMQDLNQQSPPRFLLYDRLILWLLKENPSVVPGIFVRLFQKNGADKIFQFLNEGTHLRHELYIMASTEWRHFFKAIWHSIIRKEKSPVPFRGDRACPLINLVLIETYEQPLVAPQVLHLRHVPLRTNVILPHSEQESPVYPSCLARSTSDCIFVRLSLL